MFRAIADYFGGASEEPQCPLETLINEWLGVDMADRPQDDIVMIESTKPDFENGYIRDAVSFLMRVAEPELEPSDGESTVLEFSYSEEDEEEEEEKFSERDMTDLDWDRPEVDVAMIKSAMADYVYEQTLDAMSRFSRMWRELELELEPSNGESECTNGEEEEEEQFSKRDRTDLDPLPLPACLPSYHPYSEEENFQNPPLYRILPKLFLGIPLEPHHQIRPEIRIVHCEAEQEVPNNLFVLPRRYARMYSHVLDATSKDYTSLHKAEIQQRIHEVERGQKLKKYKSEKVINKGPLNRQNKNYLFQSSCKKNRRRDLQRSPSGAKNNRKCNC